MNGPGRIKLEQEIPGSGWSMHGYILTYPGFKLKIFDSSGFSTEGALIYAYAVSHYGSDQTNPVDMQYFRLPELGFFSGFRTVSSSK